MVLAVFKIGDRVHVAAQDYDGDIVEVRGTDYLVRYVVPGARKPFYETWWPQYLMASRARLR